MKSISFALAILFSPIAFAQNTIAVSATGGLAKLTNAVDSSSTTFGAEFNAQMPNGFGLGGLFLQTVSIAANRTSGDLYTYANQSFSLLAVQPSISIAAENVSIKFGLLLGALSYDTETRTSHRTIASIDSTDKVSATKFATGPSAGISMVALNHLRVAFDVSFLSTIGKGQNIKRIDPRLSLGYVF